MLSTMEGPSDFPAAKDLVEVVAVAIAQIFSKVWPN
jgi:hypothetical protein